jgi:hypothetical protein
MSYLEGKRQRNEALLRAFGYIQGSEEPPSEPEKVDFDGGARESAPSPSNPMQDHDEWVLNLLQDHRGGGAIDFWPMAPAKSPHSADPGEEPDQGEDWRKGGG